MFDTSKYTMGDYIDCRNLEQEAYNLFKKGEYDEAIVVINEAIGIIPEDDRCWFVKGLICTAIGKERSPKDFFTTAKICFNKAATLNPADETYKIAQSSTLYEFANYFYQSGDDKTALEFINEFLSMTEDKRSFEYANGLNLKGLILFELGKYEESNEFYNIALQILPGEEQILINKLNCLYQWANFLFNGYGKHEESLNKINEYLYFCNKQNKNCDKGLKLKREVLFDWGLEKYDSKDYEGALNIVNELQSLPIDKTSLEYSAIINFKGIIFYNIGKYNEAIECYNIALEISPDEEIIITNKQNAIDKLNNA